MAGDETRNLDRDDSIPAPPPMTVAEAQDWLDEVGDRSMKIITIKRACQILLRHIGRPVL